MTSALLELDAAARTYPGAAPVRALVPTSLAIDARSYVRIMGASGSGKSTLLNLLGLLDAPSEGRYLVAGIDTGSLSETERTALRARFVGFVFQASHLLATRTASENVEMGMLYAGQGRAARRQRAADVLDRVGLAHRRQAAPPTLSGGERQRLAIARALAMQPKVLLCDEPTGNLDSTASMAVMALIEELNRSEGLTVVVVTHDRDIAGAATRQLSVCDGQVSE